MVGSGFEGNQSTQMILTAAQCKSLHSRVMVGADLNAFSIYNIQGKLVSTTSQYAKNIVDFSEYNNGIYIIKANTNKGTIIKKIIKN